jgi:hypothetical protein
MNGNTPPALGRALLRHRGVAAMSLENAVRKTVEGLVGKLVLASALTLLIAASGWIHSELSGLHSEISGHSSSLADISRQVVDLTGTVKAHDTKVDGVLDRLTSDDSGHAVVEARQDQEIEQLKHEIAPPHYERESMIEVGQPAPPSATSVPQPLPAIGAAINHPFKRLPGGQPYHRGRSRER